MIYVAIAKLISEKSVEMLSKSGFEVNYNKNGTSIPPEQVANLIKNAEGVLAGVEKYDSAVMDASKQLKCISRVGESTGNIDVNAAKEKGITVLTVDPKIKDKYLAEMVFSALHALSSKIGTSLEGKPRSLYNSRILLIGYNQLAINLTSLLSIYEPTIHIYDATKEVPFKYYCSLRKEVAQNSIIIICSKEKNDAIGPMLKYMPKSTLLLDPFNKYLPQADIELLISKGQVAGYWTCSENVKLGDDRVVVTPYANHQTRKFLEEIEENAVKNLLDALGSK